MNQTLRTNNSNNRIVISLMILGLFTLFLSGCGQPAAPTNTTANTAPANNSAPTNTAANNAATNTATNSEVAKANTNTEAANTSAVAAPPKPDNCDGPADNEVIVYEDIFSSNGGGKCVKLKPGEYKTAAEMGFANDSMSSIKVGVNVRATVCDNENFTAPCEEFEKTDYNLMDNPTIKNDTASSIKVIEVKAETKPESKPEAIETFKNTLVGEWSVQNFILKFTENTKEERRVNEEKPYNTEPYKFVDGKTLEFISNDARKTPLKAIMTFEDNGNTLNWYRPDTGNTYKLKRVNPK